jgi:integrase
MSKRKLKNIQRVRKGATFHFYYRNQKTGFRKRLPDELDPAFILAYGQAKLEDETKASKRPDEIYTYGDLVNAFKASHHFQNLAELTKKSYTLYLENISYRQTSKAMLKTPLAQIDGHGFEAVRDIILAHGTNGEKTNCHRSANFFLTVIKRMFRVMAKYIDYNPSYHPRDILPIKHTTNSNRPWTTKEFEVFMREAHPTLALRISDMVKLSWSARNYGEFLIGKTSQEHPITEPLELKEILDPLEQIKQSPIIVVTQGRKDGVPKPYTTDGFRTQFTRTRQKLLKQGKVGEGLTFHGLRHFIMTRGLEAGCSDAQLRAIGGHISENMIRLYTKKAQMKQHQKEAISMIFKNTK